MTSDVLEKPWRYILHWEYHRENYPLLRVRTDTENMDRQTRTKIQVLYLKNHKMYLYYKQKVSLSHKIPKIWFSEQDTEPKIGRPIPMGSCVLSSILSMSFSSKNIISFTLSRVSSFVRTSRTCGQNSHILRMQIKVTPKLVQNYSRCNISDRR